MAVALLPMHHWFLVIGWWVAGSHSWNMLRISHQAIPRWHRNKVLGRSFSSALFAGDDDAPLDRRQAIHDEIVRLYGDVNVKSPKQVALRIFGRPQSVSRSALQAAVDDRYLTADQRRLAELVLEYREVSRMKEAEETNESTVEMIDELVVHQEELVVPAILEQDEFSAHQQLVEGLFARGSQVDPYWKEALLHLSRPTARALVAQLDATQCPMGFSPTATPQDVWRLSTETTTSTLTAGKKGTFLAYCREQKQKYPDAIILTRCGDFYETYGVDAILLVEHAGLNAMAGKAKAGCPIRNVQATLDCLTSQGFRVAVYEEASDTDASPVSAAGGAKSRIKNRFLAQIVSDASPTYLYDLILSCDATDALVTAPPSRPYIGIVSLQAGYTVVQVDTEERTVRVSQGLTPEAVACRLTADPPADPLLYVPATDQESTRSVPFLPSRSSEGRSVRVRILPLSLVPQPRAGVSELERVKNMILTGLLPLIETRDDDDGGGHYVTADDFVLVSANASSWQETLTHPLYLETATQLGLMHDRAIPSLVSYLLPEAAPAATRRFLRRFLLTPPPPPVADAMRHLIGQFLIDGPALPRLVVPPLGKVLALLRAGQASAPIYGELIQAMTATVDMMDTFADSSALESLMILLEHESGLAANATSLVERCVQAMDVMEAVVSPIHHHGRSHQAVSADGDGMNAFGNVIPGAFLERNELSWRGRVRREAAPEAYARVEETAQQLAEVVAEDFWDSSLSALLDDEQAGKMLRTPIVQDIFNNLIALRDIPSFAGKDKYIHPRDRFGKVLRNRYTTEAVQDALSDYVNACETAQGAVSSALVELSRQLLEQGHIPAIVQAAHANLIVSSAFYHAAKARSLGWTQASVYELDESGGDSAGQLVDLWPYWMDRSEAVANSFDLNGMWLLTAPNMAGKSTVLRSTAAAALLSACGLCAPLGPGSKVRRFDHLFVRGASSDVPTEQKSAFGAEMGDVAALLRCCGDRSLVFVDELGRGTSPRDGTRLAGAVLEEMATAGMCGIFATHLHDILGLPLNGSDRIAKKRMAIHERDETGSELSRYAWTYRLEDGVCTDSMALITAARFGLPQRVIDRAESFAEHVGQSAILTRGADSPKFATTNGNNSTGEVINGLHIDQLLLPHNGLESLDEIAQLLKLTTGQRAKFIPPSWTAPPSLEDHSCVYVLQFDSPRSFYVGETDNIRKRLDQHRSKGGRWSAVEAMVIPVPGGKSDARAIESRLIRTLARVGAPLESFSDGRTIRSTNNRSI